MLQIFKRSFLSSPIVRDH